jgi:hypothetical protein
MCLLFPEVRPCEQMLLVAAPAVDLWFCGMWHRDKPLLVAPPASGMPVVRMMAVVPSPSRDGMDGSKAAASGCEQNIKPTNCILRLPAHVGGNVTMSIQISIDFWGMKLIICHLLYCYNSLHSSRTQVFMCCVCISKQKLHYVITWVLFNYNLFIMTTPPKLIVVIYVRTIYFTIYYGQH